MGNTIESPGPANFWWGVFGAVSGNTIKLLFVISRIDDSQDDWNSFLFGLDVLFGAIPTFFAILAGVGLVLWAITRIDERRVRPLGVLARGLAGGVLIASIFFLFMVLLLIFSWGGGFWSSIPWVILGLVYPDLGFVAGAMAGMFSRISWVGLKPPAAPTTVLDLN